MTSAEKALAGLWEHQRRAVDEARRYLAEADVEGQSALITMPTGTGKTGVIAAITTCLPEVTGHRLVLTPWDALVKQLIDDLQKRFWDRLPPRLRPPMIPVRRLPPSAQLSTLPATKPTIFVATIAAISVAAKTAHEEGTSLPETFAGFGCVLVDEGHYEPAATWSDAIRALGRRTILLTATPYRNDRKFFHIKDWRYRLRHQDAVDQRYLREPQFAELTRHLEPSAFAGKLIETVKAMFPGAQDVRVIVRCATDAGIRRMVRALRAQGQSVIGVHERFRPGEDPDLRRAVPSTDGPGPTYWVHQNKLIEGIDDPRFKVLAFYDALKNGRAIIQQIGRVLRNPARNRNDTLALVVSRGDRDIRRTWSTYRTFDRQDEAESAATLPGLVSAILEAQPVAFYYDGAYRSPIDLDSPDAWREFEFPFRTRVFRRRGEPALTVDEIAETIAAEWQKRDRIVYQIQQPVTDARIIPSVRVENSRFLRDATFIEPKFGYTVMRLDNDLLFLYDTAGSTPEVVAKHFAQLRPPDLQILFPDQGSQLTGVALLSTDVGRQAPRSRQLRAAAIADLAPDLADYAYVCTVAEGYTEIADYRFRRYLGISRSRISDFRSGEKDFVAYIEWLDELKLELAASRNTAVTFDRYATYVDDPDDKTPAHILLDIDPTNFVQEETRDPLQIDDRAVEVDANGSFNIQVANEGVHHPATVRWDEGRARYEIACPSLSNAQYVNANGDGQELIGAINSEQLLRIVPAERSTIYAHGSFYKPIIPVLRSGRFQLLNVLRPVPELAQVTSEKGTKIVGDDWEGDCVFGLVSALSPTAGRTPPEPMSTLIGDPEMVLCTDMGPEEADFVITTPQRVVFVHAKASQEESFCSASALHDVASQAIKNLPHLQPMSILPLNRSRWARPWKSGHVTGTTHRLRYGQFGSSEQMWKHISARITAPDIEREVWLVLGKALSKQALQEQAAKRPPRAEAIQVFSLLQTTWGAVSQLGARLRIFCSP